MTAPTSPTGAQALSDEQIADLASDYQSTYTHGGTTFDTFDSLGFARALLALSSRDQAGAVARSEHYDEVKATLQGAHSIMETVSSLERRVGPVGSHARGYTHKITKALRHLDALAAPGAAVAAREQKKPALKPMIDYDIARLNMAVGGGYAQLEHIVREVEAFHTAALASREEAPDASRDPAPRMQRTISRLQKQVSDLKASRDHFQRLAASREEAPAASAPPRVSAAIRTLNGLGYTYEGGVEWKPPLGRFADYEGLQTPWQIFGVETTEGDRRLLAMLVNALGSGHPAIDDLVSLFWRTNGRTAPTDAGVIERTKRMLALVDEYELHQNNITRAALRQGLMAEFESLIAASKS